MAHPKPTLFFSFLFLFLLSHQIHARDSQFFSKVTNDNNPKVTTETVVTPRNNDNQRQVDQQEPTFIPETQNNGYGLYGHESGQFSPSETSINEEHFTTTKTTTGGGVPYTTTSANPVSTYETDDTSTPTTYEPYTTPITDEPYTTPTTYKPYTTPIGRPYKTESEEENKYAYNNAQFYNNNENESENYKYNKNNYNSENEQRSETRGYNNYNTNKGNTNNGGGNDRSYNPERQGMSDTRFMENGKYFYDINMEKNYDPNSYRNSRVVAEPRNNWYNNRLNNHNNYYGHNNNANDRSYETNNNNNNSFEGYQNQREDQFEDNDEEP